MREKLQEPSETQKLFLRLLEAKGYDMRQLYDYVDPQMSVEMALSICEIIHGELQRRQQIMQDLWEEQARLRVGPVIIIPAPEAKKR